MDDEGTIASVPSGRHWKAIGWVVFYLIIPAVIGLMTISRAFLDGDYLPVDSGDDGVHTFIETTRVLQRLLLGEILKINLYSNFGTPMLGEPVICPFAIHAITYFLFHPVVAMVINKAVIATFTVIALTAFFSRFLSLAVSSLCAALTFSDVTFFYFFQHHPHQGALLYYTLTLLAIYRMSRKEGVVSIVLIYFSSLAFFLGVGINGILFGSAFLIIYSVVLCGRRIRLFCKILFPFASAMLVVHPHLLEFFRLAKASARIGISYVSSFSSGQVWRGLMVPVEGYMESSVAIYPSWPVVVLTVFGCSWLLWRFFRCLGEDNSEATKALFPVVPLVIVCGLLPLASVLLLVTNLSWLDSIPGLRSVNIIRFLWFSNVFMMLGCGVGIQRVLNISIFTRSRFLQLAFWVVLLGCLQPRFQAFQKLKDMCLARREDIEFSPAEILSAMTPQTRMALSYDPIYMIHDFSASKAGVLGSAARSIILDGGLKRYLLEQDLVQEEYSGMVYYFKPSSPERLSLLGIRWFVTCGSDQGMAELGWKLRKETSGLFLFENPQPITPVYLEYSNGERTFIGNYELDGNEIRIQLPSIEAAGDLVVTFVAHPCWKAYVDGNRIPIAGGENRMIRLRLERSVKSVRLVYEPYSDLYLVCSAFFSLFLLLVFVFLERNFSRKTASQLPPQLISSLSR